MTLYLLGYNKYFNRKIKYESSLSEYLPFQKAKLENISFIPNDSVNTTQIVNLKSVDNADYLVVTEGTTVSTTVIKANSTALNILRLINAGSSIGLQKGKAIVEKVCANHGTTFSKPIDVDVPMQEYFDAATELGTPITDNIEVYKAQDTNNLMAVSYVSNETIKSRWFITNYKRLRSGQYELTLRRDVLVDHIENIKKMPLFVEKAIVDDTNPLIVNDEGMLFNKIKTKEFLLKDKSESSWIVGYIAKNKKAVHIELDAEGNKKYTPLAEIAAAMGTTEEILAAQCILPKKETIETYFAKEVDFYYHFDVSGVASSRYVHNYFNSDFTKVTMKPDRYYTLNPSYPHL